MIRQANRQALRRLYPELPHKIGGIQRHTPAATRAYGGVDNNCLFRFREAQGAVFAPERGAETIGARDIDAFVPLRDVPRLAAERVSQRHGSILRKASTGKP